MRYIKIKDIMAFLVAVVTFIYMQPYFTWSTYKNVEVITILSLVLLVVSVINLFLSFAKNGFYIRKNHFFAVILFVYAYVIGEESQIGSIGVLFQYILIILLFITDDHDKLNIFEKFRKLVAILLIPSICIFILNTIGIKIPYLDIIPAPIEYGGRVYLHYPMVAQLANSWNYMPIPRLCGVFDEPGLLGTFAALILCARASSKKDWYDYIWIIAGCLSLSTAFLILVGFFYIGTHWRKITNALSTKKFMVISFVVIIVLVIVWTNWDSILNLYSIVFGKLTASDTRGFVPVWNRIVEEYGNRWWKYLFGNGYYSMNFEYEFNILGLIHDIGLLGVFIQMLFIFTHGSDCPNTKESLIFRFTLILSCLQRPYILYIPYMLIFTSGVASLNYYGSDGAQYPHLSDECQKESF